MNTNKTQHWKMQLNIEKPIERMVDSERFHLQKDLPRKGKKLRRKYKTTSDNKIYQ